MRIAFLCGSLEPGFDGVGDYVRRLAVELTRQGQWVVTIISLNDSYVVREESITQRVDDKDLYIIRIPSIWPIEQQFIMAKKWIDRSDAKYLSLQFVPFSFHPKGLPFLLDKHLAKLGSGRIWHFMMHELWVGMDQAASIKHIWWGRIQKHLIKSLISRIKPSVIHTQTILYQIQLKKLGFDSHYLPLFSNIPNINMSPDASSVYKESVAFKQNNIYLVVFGTIHHGAKIRQLAHDAAQYAKRRNVVVTLTMIGRCGSEQNHWAVIWKEAGLPLIILGEQPPNRISEVLSKSSLGIATTPAFLIGKSGTAAAMQEHGLPVLCVSSSWQPKGVTNLPMPIGVAVYQPGDFERYLVKREVSTATDTIFDIAKQMSTDLLSVM